MGQCLGNQTDWLFRLDEFMLSIMEGICSLHRKTGLVGPTETMWNDKNVQYIVYLPPTDTGYGIAKRGWRKKVIMSAN